MGSIDKSGIEKAKELERRQLAEQELNITEAEKKRIRALKSRIGMGTASTAGAQPQVSDVKSTTLG